VASSRDLPIGVFDSGVGGLTVLRALRERLPAASFTYLGDTARLPYGTKSPGTVRRYAEQAAGVLIDRGVQALVIACNTASSAAVEHLQRRCAPIPVFGVIEPGAAAAVAASKRQEILVLATEGTVQGGAYERAIRALRPDAAVVSLPCPLFVAFAEEGWADGPIAEAVARRYIGPVLAEHPGIDTVVLGCTHFPVLRGAISVAAGPTRHLVDSAATTASEVFRRFGETLSGGISGDSRGEIRFLATDAPQRFARVGSVFLGEAIAPAAVELVDL
jgi:glutamate racemase